MLDTIVMIRAEQRTSRNFQMTESISTDSPTTHGVQILSYEDFSALVQTDIRGAATEDEYNWLRHPDNVLNWLRELYFIKNSVESNLSFLASERTDHPSNPSNFDGSEAKANAAGWKDITADIKRRRTRAMKFLSYVNARVQQASYIVSSLGILKFDDIAILNALHTVENMLIDKEPDTALHYLSKLIDNLGLDEEEELVVA